jgi:GT2 family glycosyltransferase
VSGTAMAGTGRLSPLGASVAEERPISPDAAISVVVATRDRPAELGRCLRSLLAQSHPPQRIIVTDDAPGGQETPRTVARCDSGTSLVKYVEADGRGLAAAHNRGLLEVDTLLVAFTDDDVVADRGWLARVVEAFSVSQDVGCVTGMILPLELETAEQVWLEGYAGFNKGPERRLFDLAENHPGDPLFPFAAGTLGSGANMAFSMRALGEIGGFDPALGAGTPARGGDDLAAFLEVLLHGYRLVYEPQAVVHHRHARNFPALRRQVYGYGVGLTAYLTKCLLDRPRLAIPVARQLPRALAHALGARSAKNARRPADYPRVLVRLERLGMLAGPAAYLRSRRQSRRRRGPRHGAGALATARRTG